MILSTRLRKAVCETLATGESTAIAMAIVSNPARAQRTAEAPQAQAAGPSNAEASDSAVLPGALEEVEVTGSRIRRINPVGSPVIGLDREALLNTTGSNVVDALKQVPQVFTTGVTDAAYQTTSGSGGSNLTRGAAINLRGISARIRDLRFPPPTGAPSYFLIDSLFPTRQFFRTPFWGRVVDPT